MCLHIISSVNNMWCGILTWLMFIMGERRKNTQNACVRCASLIWGKRVGELIALQGQTITITTRLVSYVAIYLSFTKFNSIQIRWHIVLVVFFFAREINCAIQKCLVFFQGANKYPYRSHPTFIKAIISFKNLLWTFHSLHH